MSRTLELPDAVYDALERAATARGLTPAAWIAATLPPPPATEGPKKSLAERMAGHIGVFASGVGNLSEDTGRKFAEGMEEKRKEGRL